MFASPPPEHTSEYVDKYQWSTKHNTGGVGTWTPREGTPAEKTNCALTQGLSRTAPQPSYCPTTSCTPNMRRDPSKFASGFYPSVYREMTIRRDEKGHYIDPFKNLASKPYGRRLIYDQDHPDKMYASQWSSELADIPGPYSFPTTTGLDAEIPWTKDLQWQSEGEIGQWPTGRWKAWTQVAECPPYDGHDDQVEYSQYKVQV